MAIPYNNTGSFPVAAGVLLGIWLGGFFDGIGLHQVVQWHHLRWWGRGCLTSSVGLLHPIRRNRSSGHRRYAAADLSVIETLACLRIVGMSIDEMRRYLPGAAGASAAALMPPPCRTPRVTRSCLDCS